MSIKRTALTGSATLLGTSLMLFAAAPGVTMDMSRQNMQDQEMDDHDTTSIAQWPEVAQKAYKEMEGKYGDPNGVTKTRLVWLNKGPFAEIILIDEAIDHNFPKPHKDCLEHVVAYEVPVEKVGQLAEFDGSVIVDRTRGTLSARCDSEPHNVLALNLAVEIINGEKSVEEARKAYGEAVKQEMSGNMPEMAKSLQFEPARSMQEAGDPDKATVGGMSGDKKPMDR